MATVSLTGKKAQDINTLGACRLLMRPTFAMAMMLMRSPHAAEAVTIARRTWRQLSMASFFFVPFPVGDFGAMVAVGLVGETDGRRRAASTNFQTEVKDQRRGER